MDLTNHETPQKTQPTTLKTTVAVSSAKAGTPNGRHKLHHPRTPNDKGSCSMKTCSSSSSSSIHIFSSTRTPPAKRFQRIRNPFEAALADRLHLPLIGSPSMFQRPVTPQLSSTQFEWTIDEVSQLKPAHLEPHETQFHDSPDPDYENKVQSAISSYFKEQQIVPSPVDCPLRSQRIILAEMNGNTPISKPGRRIRDCGTQTQLSLPPILPPELEEALRPYFQTTTDDGEMAGNAGVEHSRRWQRHPTWPTDEASNRSGGGTDAKDTSLRRKLFDMHNIIVLDSSTTPTRLTNTSPPQSSLVFKSSGHGRERQSNSSPLSLTALHQHTAIAGKLSDSLDKSSFGSLSPISATDGLSISSRSPSVRDGEAVTPGSGASASKRKLRLSKFLYDINEVDMLSPIHPPMRRIIIRSSSGKRTQAVTQPLSKETYRSPLNLTADNTFADMAASNAAGATATTSGWLDLGDSMAGTAADAVELDGEKFTPDRSSSPMPQRRECASELSTESFNIRVSRLAVNSAKCQASGAAAAHRIRAAGKQPATGLDLEMFMHDDTEEMIELDEEDIQVSQLSAHSSNCSSSNSDTPRSKRRSANRKNLSQSFSVNWLENDECEPDEEDANGGGGGGVFSLLGEKTNNLSHLRVVTANVSQLVPATAMAEANKIATALHTSETADIHGRTIFHRTDSGFNEMTSSSSINSALQYDDDAQREVLANRAAITTEEGLLCVSPTTSTAAALAVCSSTPSKLQPLLAEY